MGFLNRMKSLFGAAPAKSSETELFVVKDGRAYNLPLKTGEQTGKMSDPQGRRVYHEYFVEEDRGDGHFPWLCRVYSNNVVVSQKAGLATSPQASRQQADEFGLATKKRILEQQP